MPLNNKCNLANTNDLHVSIATSINSHCCCRCSRRRQRRSRRQGIRRAESADRPATALSKLSCLPSLRSKPFADASHAFALCAELSDWTLLLFEVSASVSEVFSEPSLFEVSASVSEFFL